MSRKKQKLELTWIGKDERPRLEPRILLENPEESYPAKERVSENNLGSGSTVAVAHKMEQG